MWWRRKSVSAAEELPDGSDPAASEQLWRAHHGDLLTRIAERISVLEAESVGVLAEVNKFGLIYRQMQADQDAFLESTSTALFQLEGKRKTLAAQISKLDRKDAPKSDDREQPGPETADQQLARLRLRVYGRGDAARADAEGAA